MIAVFGATGNIGGAACSELRRQGVPVRAVVRDASKADGLAVLGCGIASADLHDPEAIASALCGAEGVLVVCPLDATSADPFADAGRTIAAIGSGLGAVRPRKVVAISDYGAERASGTGVTVILHRLEQRLVRIALEDLTFVRSAEHMQNWSRSIPSAIKRGVLPSFHHPITKQFPTVWAPDVGRVAAGLLSAPMVRTQTPRIVYVEGPRRYSASDVADTLAVLLGHPVVAQALPREHWIPALVGSGLSETYARLVVELSETHNAGGIEIEDGVGERRRGATTLAEGLAAITERT